MSARKPAHVSLHMSVHMFKQVLKILINGVQIEQGVGQACLDFGDGNWVAMLPVAAAHLILRRICGCCMSVLTLGFGDGTRVAAASVDISMYGPTTAQLTTCYSVLVVVAYQFLPRLLATATGWAYTYQLLQHSCFCSIIVVVV